MWNGNLLRSLRDTLSSLTLRPLQEVLKRGVCGEMCVCKGGGGGVKSQSQCSCNYAWFTLVLLEEKRWMGPLVDLMIGMSRLGKTMVKIRYDWYNHVFSFSPYVNVFFRFDYVIKN